MGRAHIYSDRLAKQTRHPDVARPLAKRWFYMRNHLRMSKYIYFDIREMITHTKNILRCWAQHVIGALLCVTLNTQIYDGFFGGC